MEGFSMELLIEGVICIIVVHIGGGSIVKNMDTYVGFYVGIVPANI